MSQRITKGSRGGYKREREVPTIGEPSRGGHSGRSRHAVQGAETTVRGWQVSGVEEFWVDDIPLQERS